jgi:hypothetical protein
MRSASSTSRCCLLVEADPLFHEGFGIVGIINTRTTITGFLCAYPNLSKLIDGRRDLPTGNRIENNVAVDCRQLLHLSGKKEELAGSETRKNIAMSAKEAGMLNPTKLNFRLRSDSAVFKNLRDFQPIPFERIGLMQDEYRTSLSYIVRTITTSPSGTGAFDSNTDVQRTNQK